MCRLAAYLGPPLLVSSLVTEPKNSIIHQSYHSKGRLEPLSGDGFGLAWYAPQHCEQPAIFKDISPAWNNRNLKNISKVTKSNCIFAHVRAASTGAPVSQDNCHPFSWEQYSFMHNGSIEDFSGIRRELSESLSDVAYSSIGGYTDSEHVFAIFIDKIKDLENPGIQDIANSLVESIFRIEELKIKNKIQGISKLNLVVSDGKSIVATRYISSGEESKSLYYAKGSNVSCTKDKDYHMEEGGDACLLASEPLSANKFWKKVKNNHVITIDSKFNILSKPIGFM